MNEPVNTVIGIDSTVIEYQGPGEGAKRPRYSNERRERKRVDGDTAKLKVHAVVVSTACDMEYTVFI